MFKYFFSYYDTIPPGAGFEMFGPGHLIVLAVIAAAAVFICRHYRKLPPGKRRAVELLIGWTILALDLLRYAFLILFHELRLALLPLHLCGLAVYITFINAVRPGPVKKEILYSLCMPGAAMALIFPAWTPCPIISLVSLECFLIHALIVIYPLMLFAGGDFRPNWRNLPKYLLFIVSAAIPVYIFNKLTGTNFMFINTPLPGTPLELFADWFGNPGYILGILFLIVLVWILLYVPFIPSKKHKFGENTGAK